MKYLLAITILFGVIILGGLFLLEKGSNHRYIVSYKGCTEDICGPGHIEVKTNGLFDLGEFNKLTNNTKAITNIYKVY